MSTLYKRATPSQAMLLRIIAGAVKNASDAHPTSRISDRMARSIAKRAAGTISAHWAEMLAVSAERPSERPSCQLKHGMAGPTSQDATVSGAAALSPGQGPHSSLRRGRLEGRDRRNLRRRSPLARLWTSLSWRIGEAKRAGQEERAEAFIEIIRIVDGQLKEFQ